MIAHLHVTSLSHLHCQLDFDWRSDLFFSLNLWRRARLHLTAASRINEWRTTSGVVPRSYSNTTSLWWRTRTLRGACSSWSRAPSSLVLPYFSELPHLGDLAASRPCFWWRTRDRLRRLLRNRRYFYLRMVFSSRRWSLLLVARPDPSIASQ